MGLKILLVYLLGILLCQPVYIWGIRTLCRMEDEDEELYCQDNGMYYEPSKPNYPLVIVLLLMAGIFWPLVILFAVFVPLTFLLMDKMGQLHPKDDDGPRRGHILMTGWGEIPALFVNEGEFTNGNRTEYIHRYFV